MHHVRLLTLRISRLCYHSGMYRHWPTSKFAEAEQFLSALKKEENVQRIGAVGYVISLKRMISLTSGLQILLWWKIRRRL